MEAFEGNRSIAERTTVASVVSECGVSKFLICVLNALAYIDNSMYSCDPRIILYFNIVQSIKGVKQSVEAVTQTIIFKRLI